jgi:hypothetical protein
VETGSRRGNRWRGGLQIAAVAVFVIGLPGVAHAKPASKLVIAPKAGQKVESSPVRVSVRAAWKTEELSVRLNGKSLSREFDRAKVKPRNRRTVRVSASHGLRYGKNVVRVTRKHYAKQPRRQRVRFRLTRDRPLVGAGRDRRVEVGRSIRLNARASRPRNAPRTNQAQTAGPPGTPAGLEMRWRLVRKPRGSEARHEGFDSDIQPTDAELAAQPKPGAQPARPRLARLDRPGRYVSELVVVDRGVESVADRVVINAVNDTPLVPIDTAASVGGEQGMAIGYHPAEQGGRAPQGPNEEFFPLGSSNALQLVVLDRKTLETVESWSGPPTNASIETLTAKLKGYDDSHLAIVTAWRDPAWVNARAGNESATFNLVETPGHGVSLIGASKISSSEEAAYDLEQGGQLSWIGVPGFSIGDAWELSGGGLDSLQGFLSFDNNDNYAYLGPNPTTYDLGPDGQSVAMTVGPNSFHGSMPAGESGFLIAYMSGTTLEPVIVDPDVGYGQVVYVTNRDGTPDLGGLQMMTDDLKAAIDQSSDGGSQPTAQPLVVAIRSIGPAPLAGYQGSKEPDQQYADFLYELAELINNLGGTPQLIWGMATEPTGNDSYSLLGSNSLAMQGLPPEGTGADLGSQLKPKGQTHLSGILSRDKQSRYVPKMAANQPVGAALYELALAEPTEWPFSSTPDEQAALRCIGQARGLGPDPRVPYWQQEYSDAKWIGIQEDIKEMVPSACPDVNEADFTNVRDELVTEIGWLVNVHSYLDGLTSPFTADGLSTYADLQSITEEVIEAVDPPPAQDAGIDGLAIFADALDLLADFDFPGAGAVAGAFFLADDLSALTQDGPTIDWDQRIRAESAKVGQELAQQLEMIAAGNERLAGIIAADHAKLSKVGELGQCTPGETGCTPEWQFTQQQQNAASRMYEITAKREIWGGVLPAGYPHVLLYTTRPISDGIYQDFKGPLGQISGIECGIREAGWKFQQPFPVEEPVFMVTGLPPPEGTFMVFSQSNFEGRQNPLPTDNFPSPGLLNPLFAPLDPGGDPAKGGLGLDQYSFMIDNWPRGGPAWARANWVGCGYD